MELKGKLISKGDTVQVSEKFKKREFVIEQSREVGENVFTDIFKVQLGQDKCDLIDKFNEGDEINAHYNLRGRKWEKEGKEYYFTTIEAWKIELVSAGAKEEEPETSEEAPKDLPF